MDHLKTIAKTRLRRNAALRDEAHQPRVHHRAQPKANLCVIARRCSHSAFEVDRVLLRRALPVSTNSLKLCAVSVCARPHERKTATATRAHFGAACAAPTTSALWVIDSVQASRFPAADP